MLDPTSNRFQWRSSMKRTFGISLVIVTVAALAMSHRTEAAERASFDSALEMVAQASAGGLERSATARGEANETDRYGSLATGMPYDNEIRVGPNTKRVAVWRLQTIRFATADGRQFTWRFDGLRSMDEFPLSAIAPTGITVPAGATVSVNGEIPISP
jgi:hypothetical protein